MKLLLAFAVSITVVCGGPALAQTVARENGIQRQETTDEGKLVSALAMLDESGWERRAAGLRGILDVAGDGRYTGQTWTIPGLLTSLFKRRPTQEEQVRTGLIHALELETRGLRQAHTEDYGDYVAELIAAVAALRDRRAIDVLLANIDTGNLAIGGLAALGADSVPKVLLHVHDRDVIRRNATVRTLAQIVRVDNGGGLNPTTLDDIKVALLGAARDADRFVRTSAVEGLAAIPGRDVTRALESISQSDAYRETVAGQDVYPVRTAALKALQQRGK